MVSCSSGVDHQPCHISQEQDGEHGAFPSLHLELGVSEEPQQHDAAQHDTQVDDGDALHLHRTHNAGNAKNHEHVEYIRADDIA